MMGALHVAKDEDMELEMDMELSGGSGSGHFDGLLGFADVDDERQDQKPQHGGLDTQPPAEGGKQQQRNQLGVNGKKKRYHRHTAHQIQQMEA
jgi:hypothetical protein